MTHPLEQYLSPRGIEHSVHSDDVEVVLNIIIPFNRNALPKSHPFWDNWMMPLDLTTALDELYALFENSNSSNSDSSDSEVALQP